MTTASCGFEGSVPRSPVTCAIQVDQDLAPTQQAMAIVRKGGTIVFVGICMDAIEVPFSQILLRRLTLKGFVGWSAGDFASAFSIIEDGKIDVAPLITNRMSLDDIGEAFEKALRGEEGVILIKP